MNKDDITFTTNLLINYDNNNDYYNYNYHLQKKIKLNESHHHRRFERKKRTSFMNLERKFPSSKTIN
ncbi:hypothetical protein DERP_001652 [Dermatophagoides pteronyssinus]|uniref:Uncharacterized protein n=1 Tax=Dermatophagoides pteronyssinus TaxID=6956 RepID=A0ABQ8JB47_DERPT|nr:hypothetical protein DERP_001652 [Dermatophagoides pteronyssinus]